MKHRAKFMAKLSSDLLSTVVNRLDVNIMSPSILHFKTVHKVYFSS